MGASPPPKTAAPEGPVGVGEDDRPTVVPDFAPEDFARDSEIRARAELDSGGELTIDQARRLHADGDHERALFLLTRLLELSPLHPEASKLAAECRAGLEQQCLSAIGSESAVLVAAVTPKELKTFVLDNVSAFLFSRLDGAASVEDILDIAGLPRLLTLRHLRNLFDRGLVVTASKRPRQRDDELSGAEATPSEDSVESRVQPASMNRRSSGEGPAALDPASPTFRVIAEGDDAVGADLVLAEAVAVLEFAREHGKRHVAIVDDSTGAMVDEDTARRYVEQG